MMPYVIRTNTNTRRNNIHHTTINKKSTIKETATATAVTQQVTKNIQRDRIV